MSASVQEEEIVESQEAVIELPEEAFQQSSYDDNANMQNTLYNNLIIEKYGKKFKNIIELQAFIYLAAMRGDWEAFEANLKWDKSLACLPINRRCDRVLHIAAISKNTALVRKLVERMDEKDLELENENKTTAFCYAAAAGVVEIAEIMWRKNKRLPIIRENQTMLPLEMAILLGHKEMVSFLHSITPIGYLSSEERMGLVQAAIHRDMFDIALSILNTGSSCSSALSNLGKEITALQLLARKPFAVVDGSRGWLWNTVVGHPVRSYIPWMKTLQENFRMKNEASLLVEKLWTNIMELSNQQISDLIRHTPILHNAAEVGNINFLKMIIRRYPDLLWKVDSRRKTLFHVAVLFRQEEVFSLIYNIGAIKDLITLYNDVSGNNILHMAGSLPPENRIKIVSGAALQIQRELLWFKEVEKIVPPSFGSSRNNDKLTPIELFTKSHQTLIKEGEKWMKDTANSCMLVSTLIATVVFAAAFTIPGGNNDNGTPLFLKSTWFMVFAISDAIAMFSSIISVIFFSSVLTSRYTEDDFLVKLPTKLMVGLTTLFASIISMVLAFTATFFVVYDQSVSWVPKLIACFACVPIALFAVLHSRLWVDIMRSTYQSRFLFRPGKHLLF